MQLLKSGWLRSFVSTEARILQRLLYLSSGYFQKFSKFPLQLQPLALRSTLQLLFSGRRILQRYNRVSNSFFLTAVDHCRLDLLPRRPFTPKPCKLLIYKAFSFPSAPEVGRIIDRSQRASTVI
ncbi:hypothetical protein ALQ61_03823, partial [Pseudomonas coronafaciens pv. zizaniae]